MNSFLKHILLIIFILCVSSPLTFGQKRFTDVTESAGISHEFKVYEGMFGGGVCILDIDNDGFEDFYLTSGTLDDQLYYNNGDGTFTNIFKGSGLEETTHYVTQGVAGADVNKDGWTDLFITTVTSRDSVKVIPRARNLLFINNGDKTFRDATKEFKIDQLNSFSTGVSFGDVNADGYPDAFVGNYFHAYEGELSEINDATIMGSNQTEHGYLLINHEGKYFKNEYKQYGLDHRGFGFGGVFTDFDNDQDQDLIINHDFGYKAEPSYLLRNEYPSKKYSDPTEELEMDLKINAMGSAVGDVNEDGFMDYFVTNIKFDRFMVWDQSTGKYLDKSVELGTHLWTISWGANFADFDQDGDLDLFVSNGDLNPNCVPMFNFYFENQNDTMPEKASLYGLNDYGIGRGSAIFDIENDGDMDLIVVNQVPVKDYPVPSKTRIYRNDSTFGNWLKVSLNGEKSEPNGIGSRVKIYFDNRVLMREIDGGGSSHISQNSKIAHFGLGEASNIDSVEALWTGGYRQVIYDVKPNQHLIIEEDRKMPDPPEQNPFAPVLVVIAGIALIVLMYKRSRTSHV